MALMMKGNYPFQSYEAENLKKRMCAYYHEGYRFKPARISASEAKISNIHAIVRGGMVLSPCFACCCDSKGNYNGVPVADRYCKRAKLIRGAMPEPKNPVAAVG